MSLVYCGDSKVLKTIEDKVIIYSNRLIVIEPNVHFISSEVSIYCEKSVNYSIKFIGNPMISNPYFIKDFEGWFSVDAIISIYMSRVILKDTLLFEISISLEDFELHKLQSYHINHVCKTLNSDSIFNKCFNSIVKQLKPKLRSSDPTTEWFLYPIAEMDDSDCLTWVLTSSITDFQNENSVIYKECMKPLNLTIQNPFSYNEYLAVSTCIMHVFNSVREFTKSKQTVIQKNKILIKQKMND
jgi:hypothetical protein